MHRALLYAWHDLANGRFKQLYACNLAAMHILMQFPRACAQRLITCGRDVCRHHSKRATFREAAATANISALGSAVRQGKHLKAGKKHQRPRLVNTYVSDLLITVKSWQADSLAYTSARTCGATPLFIVYKDRRALYKDGTSPHRTAEWDLLHDLRY